MFSLSVCLRIVILLPFFRSFAEVVLTRIERFSLRLLYHVREKPTRECSYGGENRNCASSSKTIEFIDKLSEHQQARDGWLAHRLLQHYIYTRPVGVVLVLHMHAPTHCGIAFLAEYAGLASVVMFREIAPYIYAGMDLASMRYR